MTYIQDFLELAPGGAKVAELEERLAPRHPDASHVDAALGRHVTRQLVVFIADQPVAQTPETAVDARRCDQ